MTISYVGTVFLVVSLVGFSALRAAGDSRTPSLLWVGATILNVILDPLLIFGYAGFPRLGMDGAAVAALITRVFACAIIIALLHFKNSMLSFSLPGVATILSSWKGILHVGLPATAANMIIPVSAGVITALIAGFGPQAVAGFGVATRLEALALVPFFATSSIINPFVGQNAGAGKAERIREAMTISFRSWSFTYRQPTWARDSSGPAGSSPPLACPICWLAWVRTRGIITCYMHRPLATPGMRKRCRKSGASRRNPVTSDED